MPSVLKYGLGLFTKKKTQSSKFHEFQAYDHLRHPAYPISNVANGANLAGHPHLQAALPPHSFSHRQQFYPQQILPPPQIACQCQQCSYQTATLNQQPSQVQLIPNPQPHLQPPQQQHPPPAPHIQLQPLQAQPQQLQSQQQQIQQCHQQQQQQQQQPYHSYANPQNIISQPVPPPQPVASCTCQHCPLVQQQQQQQQHPHFQQHQQQQQLQIHQQQQLQLHHHHHQHQQQQHFPNGQQMQLNHIQVNGTCQYQNQQVLVNQHQQPVQQQQPLQHQQQQFIPQNHISQHQIGLSHQPQMAPIVLQPQPQPQPTPAPIHQQQQLQQHQQQQQQQFPSIQAQPPTFQCHTIQPQQFQHQKHQYQQQQHQRIQSLFPQTQMTPSQSRSQPQLALQSLHHTPQEESQSESQSRYANVSQCVINDSLHSQSHSNPKYKDHVYCNEKSYSLEVTLPPYQDPPDYDTFMIMKRKKVLYPGYSNGQHLAYHSESLDLRREKDSSYENLRSGGYDNIGINRQELGCNGTS